ncbi:transposase, partial [Streptomyces sioyaensis]|uniref:transposase n=1 Tax=Streptomyces sioyaensis TaxID=67364 RepID=UPI0033E678B3
KVFTDKHLTRLEEIIRSVCEDFEVELKEFNGESNHVHLLMSFPPLVEAGQLPQGRQLPAAPPGELVRYYWRAQRLWSGSYFDGAVGGAPPLPT